MGGQTVKLDVLRQSFEALSFSEGEMFMTSGNVVLETTAKKTKALEITIEQQLREALGV